MHAVILAGGFGKRLKPVTDYVPKPLVPIDNIPILEWQIRYLKKYGIDEITICTGYKTKQIEYFLDTKSYFGTKIKISVEKTPLGTGGAIKKVGKNIKGKSFIVINGDVITDIDLKKMQKVENSIAGIELRTQFGTLDVTEDRINSFKEKRPLADVWMNAGIYHLTKDVIKHLPVKGDIEKTAFPKLSKKRELNIIKFKDVQWFSIDSHKDIEECSKIINNIIK